MGRIPTLDRHETTGNEADGDDGPLGRVAYDPHARSKALSNDRAEVSEQPGPAPVVVLHCSPPSCERTLCRISARRAVSEGKRNGYANAPETDGRTGKPPGYRRGPLPVSRRARSRHKVEKAMTPLRQRMINDITVRGLAENTKKSYLASVKGLARHYRRSPDQISAQKVQDYLNHLHEQRRLSWQSCYCARRPRSHTSLNSGAAWRSKSSPRVSHPRLPRRARRGEHRAAHSQARVRPSMSEPRHR